MPTITIRNLEEQVKQRLRIMAAEHGRSMEAEVRDILARETLIRDCPRGEAASGSVCTAVRGAWKGRMKTDEIMALTRND